MTTKLLNKIFPKNMHMQVFDYLT